MMNFKGIRVLVLEGYARQSLPLIKAFNKLGCIVTAFCDSKLDVAYVSRYTDHRVLGICDREKIEETTEQIRQLLKSGEYDVVVPTVDFSAEILAKNKEDFCKYARVVSNDYEVYKLVGDKQKTMEICMENDIPCPKTLTGISGIDEIINSEIKFPIVLKPRVGYGAVGFHRIDTSRELRSFAEKNPGALENSVIQEYIPQTDLQYECAMFVDDNNEVKTSLVFSKNRWFPVSGGSSTLNITVDRQDIIDTCTQLLQRIGWRGAADIDLIHDPRDGKAKVMEINPRVSGSVKICFISGVDQAKQMLQLAYNQPVTKYESYEVGKRLRMSQTDILWFLKSSDRFKAKPSFFSMKNTYDQTFSWDDPLPWFAFLFRGLKRYKTEMQRRR